MISSRAQEGIQHIFRKAAKSRFALEPGDICEIEPIAHGDAPAIAGEAIVVLTISSILFRLMLILHVNEDASAREYFVKGATNRSFEEVFLEIANLCCGAMNQDLLRHFPDLGMSTPYLLSGGCIQHLEALKPTYVSRHAITINDSVKLAATICVCARAPIDFVADMAAVEECSGELELF